MNSPATFQTMMNTIFAKEIAEEWLIVYMDDILIATKDDIQFHEKCIHRMLEKLKKHDLYLKLEKCTFEQWRIKFPRSNPPGWNSTNGSSKDQRHSGLVDSTKCHRCALLPGIHRVLLLLYTKLLTHHPTPDTTHMEKHPIQLGSNMHACLWTPQVTNVHKTHTLTTWLHKSLLSHYRCLSLQCGHHTLTGGRTQPQNLKTNALPSHILLKCIHANRKELWYLWKRVPRSPESPKMLQTTCCSYRNSSHYPHGPH